MAVALVCLGLLATPLVADTVYLKNGAWIDGMVRARNDTVATIEIGSIGKLEIAVADIHEIEKNNRTGEDYNVPTDGRQLELADVALGDKTQDQNEPKKAATTTEKDDDASEDEGGQDEDDDAKWEPPSEEEIDPKLKKRIEELVEDLDRDKSRYRVRAERHLKAIGPPCVPYILRLATNERGLTRIAVFRLFYEFGDERVLESCIEGLLDTSEYVRSNAKKALRRITQRDFGYSPSSSPRRRELAQKKWAKWWDEEQKELAAIKKLSAG
jgi:hypothetical protein